MVFSIGLSLQRAFFRSLEQAGCLNLNTVGPNSDSDSEEEMGKDPDGEYGPPRNGGLVGFAGFKRNNPMTDLFDVEKFHHIEFWCGDATNVSQRFSWGLGMPLVAKSDLSTGNKIFCSYVLQSNELAFVFTAPYSSKIDQTNSVTPFPSFNSDAARNFFSSHGVAVRAVSILVKDATRAYEQSIFNGAISASPPATVVDKDTGASTIMAEVKLYGDVVLRYLTIETPSHSFLPNFRAAENGATPIGLTRIDHAVGNVPNLLDAIEYISRFTGFHEFAEFTAEDVGTVDSGLNSVVLANNNEMVLLPVNEPTSGTKRKSQIQTYLENNEGPGLQHLALKTEDIFHTLREMRKRTQLGGFDFMPQPSESYYLDLPRKIGGDLTPEQFEECKELGILVDKDDQGILLQIFTKPVGDRPTLFLEIIQRIGCVVKQDDGAEFQKGGCGGFGKGNFSELFKSIEDYERTLDGESAPSDVASPV